MSSNSRTSRGGWESSPSPAAPRPAGEPVAALEAELLAVLEAVDQAVTAVDAHGRVVRWNRAAQELYHIPVDRIVGRPISEFFAPASLMVERVLQTGRSVRSAYHQPRPGTHVLITALPIRRGDELIGAVAVERDVTRLVELSSELLDARTRVEQLERPSAGLAAAPSPGGDASLLDDGPGFDAIRGNSPGIRDAIALAERAAGTDTTVLVQGETGTGKELFARAIHRASPRAAGKFVALNCGAIPSALFESELFGYAGGAFTSANPRGQPGKMELAHGGTLFLDEVAELPAETQVKLLRALEDGRFYRVGGTQPVEVSVRIIAASNRDLGALVERGAFRADLFWRLNVIGIQLPPLRERPGDVWKLVELFLHEFGLRHGRPVRALDPGVAEALLRHPWPGNVRELRNAVERLVVLSDGGRIRVEDLPPHIRAGSAAGPVPGGSMPGDGISRDTNPGDRPQGDVPAGAAADAGPAAHPTLENALSSAARESILAALRRAGGNRAEAARLLGISRGTLYYRMRQLGLA